MRTDPLHLKIFPVVESTLFQGAALFSGRATDVRRQVTSGGRRDFYNYFHATVLLFLVKSNDFQLTFNNRRPWRTTARGEGGLKMRKKFSIVNFRFFIYVSNFLNWYSTTFQELKILCVDPSRRIASSQKTAVFSSVTLILWNLQYLSMCFVYHNFDNVHIGVSM